MKNFNLCQEPELGNPLQTRWSASTTLDQSAELVDARDRQGTPGGPVRRASDFPGLPHKTASPRAAEAV